MIRQEYLDSVALFSSNEKVALAYWDEISHAYEDKKRFYHNLQHLETLCALLSEVKGAISDWPAIVFAIVYHDIIYDPYSSANESKSAEVARERLVHIHVPGITVERAVNIILSTRDHNLSADADCNLFLDADLSVLGSAPAEYLVYAERVRKEFESVPSLIYRAGRKKILKRFLERDSIFKTNVFKDRFEEQARKNILAEIDSL